MLLQLMLTCILIFSRQGWHQRHRFFRFRAETLHGEPETAASILSAPYIQHENSQVDCFIFHYCIYSLQQHQFYSFVDFADECEYFMIPISIPQLFWAFSRLALVPVTQRSWSMDFCANSLFDRSSIRLFRGLCRFKQRSTNSSLHLQD